MTTTRVSSHPFHDKGVTTVWTSPRTNDDPQGTIHESPLRLASDLVPLLGVGQTGKGGRGTSEPYKVEETGRV